MPHSFSFWSRQPLTYFLSLQISQSAPVMHVGSYNTWPLVFGFLLPITEPRSVHAAARSRTPFFPGLQKQHPGVWIHHTLLIYAFEVGPLGHFHLGLYCCERLYSRYF